MFEEKEHHSFVYTSTLFNDILKVCGSQLTLEGTDFSETEMHGHRYRKDFVSLVAAAVSMSLTQWLSPIFEKSCDFDSKADACQTWSADLVAAFLYSMATKLKPCQFLQENMITFFGSVFRSGFLSTKPAYPTELPQDLKAAAAPLERNYIKKLLGDTVYKELLRLLGRKVDDQQSAKAVQKRPREDETTEPRRVKRQKRPLKDETAEPRGVKRQKRG